MFEFLISFLLPIREQDRVPVYSRSEWGSTLPFAIDCLPIEFRPELETRVRNKNTGFHVDIRSIEVHRMVVGTQSSCRRAYKGSAGM